MVFRGRYGFLSNMYLCPVTIAFDSGTYTFKCSESAFQACKNPNEVEKFVDLDGFEAKRLGRKITLDGTVAEWNARRDECMRLVVKAKFEQNPRLMEQLLSIKDEIVEENTWNDKYWGKCKKFDHTEPQTKKPVYILEGKNKLGEILMSIRKEHEDAK